MSVLGGVGKALSSATDKAGKTKKAGAIKSVKVKLKFNPPDPPKEDSGS